MSRPARLLLVRHGETPANLGGVWHGSTDSPLTERGLEQARRAAACVAERFPDATALYASPLTRARKTADAIGEALGLATRIEPDLREYHLGEWEGLRYDLLHREHRLWERMRSDPDFAPRGGESPRQVTDRVAAALRQIHDRHRGERVLVVGHGGALALALGFLLDGGYGQWRRVMHNCALSELVLEPEPALPLFDLRDHLEGL